MITLRLFALAALLAGCAAPAPDARPAAAPPYDPPALNYNLRLCRERGGFWSFGESRCVPR